MAVSDATQIASLAQNALPAELSRELRLWLADREAGRDRELPVLPATYHPAAAPVAAAMRQALRPVTHAIVLAWLTDLASGIPVGRDGAPLAARAGAVFIACQALPSAVFSRETLAKALQTYEWFPSAAAVYKLLKAETDAIERRISGLEAIAKADPARVTVARPAAEPYAATSVPEWALQKRVRGRDTGRDDGGSRLDFGIRPHPPVRTIAEQIAAINAPST